MPLIPDLPEVPNNCEAGCQSIPFPVADKTYPLGPVAPTESIIKLLFKLKHDAIVVLDVSYLNIMLPQPSASTTLHDVFAKLQRFEPIIVLALPLNGTHSVLLPIIVLDKLLVIPQAALKPIAMLALPEVELT